MQSSLYPNINLYNTKYFQKYHNTIENTIKAFEELSRVLSRPNLTYPYMAPWTKLKLTSQTIAETNGAGTGFTEDTDCCQVLVAV